LCTWSKRSISRDLTFDEDSAPGKAKYLPISRKDDDVAEKQEGPIMDEPIPNVDGLMDLVDRPPCDPSTSKKIPLWLKDTFQDVENHVALRGTFLESKKPNKYQGYFATMSNIIQSKPCTFKETVKNHVW